MQMIVWQVWVTSSSLSNYSPKFMRTFLSPHPQQVSLRNTSLITITGWIVSPPKYTCWSPQKVPQKVTVFEDTVFKEVFKFKSGHWGGPWSNIAGVLIKKRLGHRHTERGPYKDNYPESKERGLADTLFADR